MDGRLPDPHQVLGGDGGVGMIQVFMEDPQGSAAAAYASMVGNEHFMATSCVSQEHTHTHQVIFSRNLTAYRQSGILERFFKVFPNSHFRNDKILKNWSKILIIFC